MSLVRYVNDERAERVYAAEMSVRDMNLPGERRFTTLAEIGEYLTEVLTREWQWHRKRWALATAVTDQQVCSYRNGTIFFPTDPALFYLAARELVILHECAHHFVGLHNRHDDPFIDAFVDLVHGMLPTAAEPLQRALTEQGVFNG